MAAANAVGRPGRAHVSTHVMRQRTHTQVYAMKLFPTCQRCFEDESDSCYQKEHAPLVFKRAGTRIINDRYRLDRLLGHGGWGPYTDALT